MEYMESKMQDFYDGWAQKEADCLDGRCGCRPGQCAVADATLSREVPYSVDLDEDFPFPAKETPDANV